MNSKYKMHNCDNCSAQFKILLKMLKHIAECHKRGKTNRLYYNECGFSWKKTTLKPVIKNCIVKKIITSIH